jgi:hypothetical protein
MEDQIRVGGYGSTEVKPFREGYPKGYDESNVVSFVERYCSKNKFARIQTARQELNDNAPPILVDTLPQSLIENPPLLSPEPNKNVKPNLGRQSIAQLRAMCDDEELDHSDCIDKIDLVVLLKDHEEDRTTQKTPGGDKEVEDDRKLPPTRPRSFSQMSVHELIEECSVRNIDLGEVNRRESCSKRLDLAVAIAEDEEHKKRTKLEMEEHHVEHPDGDRHVVVKFRSFGGDKQVVADFDLLTATTD